MLLLAVVLVLGLISVLRALGGSANGDGAEGGAAGPGAASSAAATTDTARSQASASDAGGDPVADGSSAEGSADPATTAEAETPQDAAAPGAEAMVRTGTVGDGSWEFAAPGPAPADAEGTVHSYAVRVEGGLGITADEAAREVARVLADERGWQHLEGVLFQQVGSNEEAELTISLGSPPTVDELCLLARTGGLWSCRIGSDVALNSDRWLHATPTFDDLTEYRAYMINHEVGHFLGHDHARCGAAGQPAPVMLQQSMDLEGCVANAWPATS